LKKRKKRKKKEKEKEKRKKAYCHEKIFQANFQSIYPHHQIDPLNSKKYIHER